jgi:peptide/nickel transport system permease protein
VTARRLVLRRLGYLVPVLFGISAVAFLLTALVPGDVAQALLGPRATPAGLAQLRHEYGLDRSVVHQYVLYVERLAHGDLGTSVVLRESVASAIWERLPVTLFLVAYSMILAVVLAIPLAVLAAFQRGRIADHVVRVIVVTGMGFPTYWVGIMLIIFVALRTGTFPVAGYGTGFTDHLWHVFLPALTLALTFLAVIVRVLRASLIEVLSSDYVALARMKNVSPARLLVWHILRPGLLPVITLLALNASFLIGGTIVVETIFGLPGVGGLMVNAMLARDLLVVQGVTLVIAMIVVLINLFVDLLYSRVDPRVVAAG